MVLSSQKGFTLLEILVAFVILAVAITSIVQLFSSNIRAISASDKYTAAAVSAETKMRDILAGDKLEERSWSETSDDGYIMDILISETLKERNDNIPKKLMEIDLTIYWPAGSKKKSLILRTLKVIDKLESK
jgi:general secretion pathway protein I